MKTTTNLSNYSGGKCSDRTRPGDDTSAGLLQGQGWNHEDIQAASIYDERGKTAIPFSQGSRGAGVYKMGCVPKTHGRRRKSGLGVWSGGRQSLQMPHKKPAPLPPAMIPFGPTEGNIDNLKRWLVEHFWASAFNTCTHQMPEAAPGGEITSPETPHG